jgi:flagellar basal-body rod modification protein FlgD
MDVSGILASDPFFGANPLSQPADLDRDAFLELLVTQLKNQDPLEPIDNQDYIAQLAQFSSLEELQGLNQNLVGMIALNQSNALLAQLTQGSALIGKTVEWLDLSTGEPHTGSVQSVKVVDGIAVLNVDGQDVPLASVTEILGAPDGSGTGDGDGSDDGQDDDKGDDGSGGA